MLSIMTALLIATAPPPAPCCRQASRFADDTNVETSHRVGHFVSTTVLTTTFYGAARYAGADRAHARIIAVALSMTAVLAKELYDYHTAAHAFSAQDVLVGAAGTATGLVIAATIHWPEDAKSHQRSDNK